MRIFWLVIGALSFVFGLIGVAVPLLPTFPFMLAAVFAFARSSPRLHAWLLAHPRFGPPINRWRESGAVTMASKRNASVSLVAVLAFSVWAGVGIPVLIVQAIAISVVAVFLWTRPTG